MSGSNLQQELSLQKSQAIVVTSVSRENDLHEPLLQENPGRFVIFPIQYHDIWKMYKKHMVCSLHSSFYSLTQGSLAFDLTLPFLHVLLRHRSGPLKKLTFLKILTIGKALTTMSVILLNTF